MAWIRRASTFALIALTISLFGAACNDDDNEIDDSAEIGAETEVVVDPTGVDNTEPTAPESPSGSPEVEMPAGAVTIDAILADPEAFVDEGVVLTGEVDDILMPGAFTITDEENPERLLVVGAGELMPILERDETVMVRGQIDMLTIDEEYFNRLRDEFGIVFADDELLAEFDGQPLIAASSVSVVAPSIAELVEASHPYIDQRVTVRGPIVEALHPQALVMSDQRADWTSAESLLVVGPHNVIPAEIDPNAIYQVTGMVRILDPSDHPEFREEFAFLTEDDAFADFEGLPVILAESIEQIAPADALTAVLDEPDTFVDRRVQVRGEVVEVIDTRVFTVGAAGVAEADGPDDTLLVITTTPALPAGLKAGTIVTVTGTVLRLDLVELEDDLETDLDDDALVDHDDEPVLVAAEILTGN